MTCEIVRIGGSARIIIKGVVDEQGAMLLKKRFRGLAHDQFSELVIDMAGVSRIGSSGIGGLLLFYKQMAARRGTMRLVRTPAVIAGLMKEMRLDTLFEIHGD